METLTPKEKELILKAIQLMFQAGAVRGDLAFVENMVALAKSINTKLAINTLGEEVLPSMNTDGVPYIKVKDPTKR